jgi:type IV pilus assembly protein PilV
MKSTTKPLCRIDRKQSGSSLIEVLITMLIVALGLLGAGGMQLAANRYQQTSFMRGQAMAQAEFIAEKIRANSRAVVAPLPPDQASTYLAAQAYVNATLANLPADPACGLTAVSTCTSAQSAVKDLRDWRLALQALPGGRGSIEPVTNGAFTDPVSRRVVVMWREKQENEVGTDVTPAPDADPTDANCTLPRTGGIRCLVMVVTP